MENKEVKPEDFKSPCEYLFASAEANFKPRILEMHCYKEENIVSEDKSIPFVKDPENENIFIYLLEIKGYKHFSKINQEFWDRKMGMSEEMFDSLEEIWPEVTIPVNYGVLAQVAEDCLVYNNKYALKLRNKNQVCNMNQTVLKTGLIENEKLKPILQTTFNSAVLNNIVDREIKWLAFKKVNLEFTYNNINDKFSMEIYSKDKKDDNSNRRFSIDFKRDSKKITKEITIDFTKKSLYWIIQSLNMDEYNLMKIVNEIMSELKEFISKVEKKMAARGDLAKPFVEYDKTSIIVCCPKLGFKGHI